MRKNNQAKFLRVIICLGAMTQITASAKTTPHYRETTLAEAFEMFQHPADSTRTKGWWFHGEMETTRRGITADLEAMKQVGIGGVVYYDQVHGSGKGAAPFLSAEWWDMLKFSAREAQRIGLSFEANISNGYVAGGTWITPELSMQRIATTGTYIEGGRQISIELPRPENAKGYQDVAVLAFPIAKENRLTSREVPPIVTTNDAGVNIEDILSGHGKGVRFEAPAPGRSIYVNMDFKTPFLSRSITYRVSPRGKAPTGTMGYPCAPSDSIRGYMFAVYPPFGQLEKSDDGIRYEKVCDLLPVYGGAGAGLNDRTVAFPATTARYYRLHLHDWDPAEKRAQALTVREVELSPMAKSTLWQEKSAQVSNYIEQDLTPRYRPAEVIHKSEIVDLTTALDPEGVLKWPAPEGHWYILRIGHISTGAKTKHGRHGSMGLECDKMSAAAVTLHFDHYARHLIDTLAAIGCPLKGLCMDSHEAGSQNWTPGFEQDFKARRGYDITPYLPALAGFVVDSAEENHNFYRDLRRTIAELVSERYIGTLDSLCRAAGVEFTAQALGNGQSLVSNNIEAKGAAMKPQGEFWAYQVDGSNDAKDCVSAAHIYGKQIASQESFTDTNFSTTMPGLKNAADLAFSFGSNEFVICAIPFQPYGCDTMPGNTAGGREYGLTRTNPMWPYMTGFFDYQARICAVMRQGQAVNDICVLAGGDAPMKLLGNRLPDIPAGYDFDVCTDDAFLNEMTIDENRLLRADGMAYRVVCIEKQAFLSPDVVAKLEHLKRAGAVVCKAEDLTETLKGTEIQPDISNLAKIDPQKRIFFCHRRLPDAEIYWMVNHTGEDYADVCTFRTNYKYLELWNPMDGSHYRVDAHQTAKGPAAKIRMRKDEAYLVVASNRENTTSDKWPGLTDDDKTITLSGPWDVSFDPKAGGVGACIFDSLTDWTQNPNDSIRYFAGTAIYKKTVDCPTAGRRVLLRLKDIGGIAEIRVNGRKAGTIWGAPFELDLTDVWKPGANLLEVAVANYLTNRMIGDSKVAEAERITHALPDLDLSERDLMPSGLLDPVTIVFQ